MRQLDIEWGGPRSGRPSRPQGSGAGRELVEFRSPLARVQSAGPGKHRRRRTVLLFRHRLRPMRARCTIGCSAPSGHDRGRPVSDQPPLAAPVEKDIHVPSLRSGSHIRIEGCTAPKLDDEVSEAPHGKVVVLWLAFRFGFFSNAARTAARYSALGLNVSSRAEPQDIVGKQAVAHQHARRRR